MKHPVEPHRFRPAKPRKGRQMKPLRATSRCHERGDGGWRCNAEPGDPIHTNAAELTRFFASIGVTR